tara:strand:+ start:47 stop:631 length:585 start_codon:yes stop_codon:yes gene_type:complete
MKPKKRLLPVKKVVTKNRTQIGLVSGSQTRITPIVKKFVSGFEGAPSLELATKMVKSLKSHLKEKKLKLSAFSKRYVRRTASQIIESGFVEKLKGQANGIQSTGCVEYTIATCASLRAKGIPAFFVRIGAHSYTLFKVKGKMFVADLTKNKPVWELSREEKRLARIKSKKGQYAIGKDAWAVGIRNIEDFGKYI